MKELFRWFSWFIFFLLLRKEKWPHSQMAMCVIHMFLFFFLFHHFYEDIWCIWVRKKRYNISSGLNFAQTIRNHPFVVYVLDLTLWTNEVSDRNIHIFLLFVVLTSLWVILLKSFLMQFAAGKSLQLNMYIRIFMNDAHCVHWNSTKISRKS